MPNDGPTESLRSDIDTQITWYEKHYKRHRTCHFSLVGALIVCAGAAPILLVGASSSTQIAANAVSAASHVGSGQSPPAIDLTTFGIPNTIAAGITALLALLGAVSEAVRRYAQCSEKYTRYYLTWFALTRLKGTLDNAISESADDHKKRVITARAKKVFETLTDKETLETLTESMRLMGSDARLEIFNTSLDDDMVPAKAPDAKLPAAAVPVHNS